MKRFIASLYLFILCCVLVYPFNIKEVSAEEDIANKYVYYQALISKNNSYKAVSAVSQYFYTNTIHLGKTKAEGETNLPIASRSTFTSLYDVSNKQDNLCTIFATDATNLYCNNGAVPALAALKISATGIVSMELANEVNLVNLRIYYVLANRINKAHMYCQNSDGTNVICDNAKHVVGNGANVGNWSNQTKDGAGMHFSQISIKNKFTETEAENGSTIYSGYNMFNDMYQDMAALTQVSGVYVLASFAVEYQGVTYYVNQAALNKEFSADIANTSATAYKSVIINTDPKNINSTQGSLVNKIPSNAALIKPAGAHGSENNRGFSLMENFFENTLRPLIIMAIGILFVIVGTHTGVTIVKSSDEPEVRNAAIKKFIGLFIGAFLIAMILIFYKDIIAGIQRFF